MTISAWVRRKDWISAGFWGKEKDTLFQKQFGKWRRFVTMHYHRMQVLTQPNAAKIE
jgi:hypothetical protein